MLLTRISPSSVWDKMQKKTVAFSKDASNLFFHILTQCNLSCAHCYINRTQHGGSTLDIETIVSWLSIFSGKAGRTNLVFLGGEPTLHPDLSTAVKTARKMGFKSITIDTNGYLFHHILDRISCNDVDFISFSLDGASRRTNDTIRGKGSFDAVMTGIHQARQRGFSCSMIFTVSEKNFHDLEKMPGLVRDLNLDRFFIQVIGLRGKSSTPENTCQVSGDLWTGTIPKVAEAIAEHGVIVTYPKVFLNPGEPFECAGNVADNYFIFPNGRVYQCPICEDFPLHAFEIKNNRMVARTGIHEKNLFGLTIPEGCVMNKLVQPGNLSYDGSGQPCYRIACCMLKEELSP